MAAGELAKYVDRMGNIVEYQLKRAASSRISIVHSLVDVEPLLARVVDSLEKVYADRDLELIHEVAPGLQFYGEESELMELLGNLLDNAYKYCRQAVQVQVGTGPHGGVEIRIEDDGPGIAADQVETVPQRGTRMDESTPGQGIGLSMASEIISVYGGKLSFDSSELGGARLRISFHDRVV